jgi:putative zinc finger protein
MLCAEFEILLSDYVDNTLDQAQRVTLEQHMDSCASCREMTRDVTDAVRFLGRVDDVLPPPELVTRIAYHTPVGRIRDPLEHRGLMSRLFGNWLQPVLQPRIAMGMAMTILSFAMLGRCTGIQIQHIKPSDLSPARIWDGVEDRVMRGKDRAVKYYENLRLVYEVETRLKQLREQQDADESGKPADGSKTQSTPRTPATEGGQSK